MLSKHRTRELLFIFILVFCWAGWDLWGPYHGKFESFTPKEIAKETTEQWRALIDGESWSHWKLRASSLRHQWRVPYLRSFLLAEFRTHAARIFQEGQDASELEKALPTVEREYQALSEFFQLRGDPSEAARREVEWEILFRYGANTESLPLVMGIADTYSLLLGVPSAKLMDFATLYAQALALRGEHRSRTLTPSDWVRIQSLLTGAYVALKTALAG